jgi:hypothetical protein
VFAGGQAGRARFRAAARREGRELGTLVLAHPFRGIEGGNGEWDYDVPMLPGDHVTDDAGTGFVHTAPSHGDDDYQLGLKFGLPMTYNVEPDGSYRADLPLFGGQHIILPDGKEGPANVSVIKQLAYSGALFAKAKLKHSYPHSWRSKAPVIYRNTPQWFVPSTAAGRRHGRPMATRSAARALTSINQLVNGRRRPGATGCFSMIEARPDWVLSRQRAWGVPLTCFREEGGAGPPIPTSCCATRRSTPASRRRSRPRAPMSGMCKDSRKRLDGIVIRPIMNRSSTCWMCGSTLARPMPSCCATGRMGRRTGSRTFIWKAPTSIAGGSIPRCCRPAGPRGARPIGAC